MKRVLFVLFLFASVQISIAGALAQTPPERTAASAQATAPMIPEDPSITKRALEWVERFQSGTIDRSQLNDSINAKLTTPELAAMRKQLAAFGTPTGIGYGGARLVRNERVYRYVVVFPVGAIQEFLSLDRTGRIDGLLFLPVH